MSSCCECPICMDEVNMTVNCVTTECGHVFHAKCLMQNVAHNGFGCPYCRTTMADVPEDEEEDEEDGYEYEEEEEEEYRLRGFRFFWNLINDEENNEEDNQEEDAYIEENEELQQEANNAPSAEHIANKLREQNVSYEDLLKCLLFTTHEKYENNEAYSRIEDEIYGKCMIIISNYDPAAQAETPAEIPAPVVQAQEEVPKNVTTRRMLMHI